MKISEIIDKLTNSVGKIINKVQYRNLVFKGGGVRGIAYMGALESLEKMGILENIERVAGSSAGAIAATLSCFRLPVSETIKLFDSLDLAKVPQTGDQKSGVRNLQPFKNAENIKRLVENYGWYSSIFFHEWIGEIIASQCEGDARATFSDFNSRKFRDLYIVTSNLSRKQTEIFSFETTPHVAVADAVRMSMSIPLFFEAVQFDGTKFGKGDYYLDGGLFDNYPLHMFDQPRFAQRNPFYRNGINWETLGLFLNSEVKKNNIESLSPENLYEFLDLTVRSFYDTYSLSNLDKNLVDQKRSVMIDDCGVSSLQFELKLGCELYQGLFESGKNAVLNFLKNKR